MAIVQSGIKVWIVKVQKNEITPPTVEIKREESNNEIMVEAEVEFVAKGPRYYLEFQKTGDFPPQSQANCKFYTAKPSSMDYWKRQGQSIQIASSQDSVIYSSRESLGKDLVIPTCHFKDEALKKYKGVTGYAQLRVTFHLAEGKAANVPQTGPKVIFFTFVFKYASKTSGGRLLNAPSAFESLIKLPAVRGLKRKRNNAQASSSESDKDPNHLEEVEGRVKAVRHPWTKIRKVIHITSSMSFAMAIDLFHQLSPESEASPQITTSRYESGTTEHSFELGFAPNLPAARRHLEEASTTLNQAQFEQWDALLEQRKAVEAETKRLNEETARIRDDTRCFKKQKF
ncbi:hypothetical protein GYMLUDRAFT_235869 [Collybiopsis luxurians FD-317 M1]|nr:hypothetical protein GYMLUDRAFT_235869 [Collybiopsis luxurians FD-317 M1]